MDEDVMVQKGSSRVCPKCKGRHTKRFSISTGLYTCQICDTKYITVAGLIDRIEVLEGQLEAAESLMEFNHD